jgi:hypothetical protein
MSAANLVLQDAVERIFAGDKYADKKPGTVLVRGENVLLLGEIVGSKSSYQYLHSDAFQPTDSMAFPQDLDKEDDIPAPYERGELAEVEKLAEEQKEKSKAGEKSKLRRLKNLGFDAEHYGENLF